MRKGNPDLQFRLFTPSVFFHTAAPHQTGLPMESDGEPDMHVSGLPCRPAWLV